MKRAGFQAARCRTRREFWVGRMETCWMQSSHPHLDRRSGRRHEAPVCGPLTSLPWYHFVSVATKPRRAETPTKFLAGGETRPHIVSRLLAGMVSARDADDSSGEGLMMVMMWVGVEHEAVSR